MASFSAVALLAGFLCTLVLVADLADGCGFPMGGGGGGGCCCCGGGRRKREAAVQPHYRSEEAPCPQTAWRQVMEKGIFADDAGRSVQGIQTALYEDFPGQKFLVSCAPAGAENAAKSDGAVAAKGGSTVLPAKVHFASSGDAYCNIQAQNVWCQAIAMSA